jgi:hypothetical protein
MKNLSIYAFTLKSMDSQTEEKCGTEIVLEFGHDFSNNIAFDLVNGLETAYCFLDNYKCEKLVKIFKKYNVLIEHRDITNKVLFGGVKITESDCVDTFDKLSKNFMIDNLTIDDILDKINEMGIESLTEIDKKILER